MFRGRLTRALCGMLDRAAIALRRRPTQPLHLQTGRRGEDLAHFHLRQLGYTIVARNWRTPRRRGEIDLVAWDGEVLCFIEVKTRTTREVKPAEAAVDRAKRRELAAMAGEYLRRTRPGVPSKRDFTFAGVGSGVPGPAKRGGFPSGGAAPTVRFDVLSIYCEDGREPACQLFKNAYSWRNMRRGGGQKI
jgi:putative endonuclease